VANVLPQSLCGWSRTSLNLLEPLKDTPTIILKQTESESETFIVMNAALAPAELRVRCRAQILTRIRHAERSEFGNELLKYITLTCALSTSTFVSSSIITAKPMAKIEICWG